MIRPITILRAWDKLAGLVGGLEDARGEAGRVEVGGVHVGAALDVEALGAVEPVRCESIEMSQIRDSIRISQAVLVKVCIGFGIRI